ncbi:MAG: YjgP/YjgQ family permease [Saprospiraceae bacterium]|nr:YjgP/YjgQ family permease [Saprospiraceae bacterium]
MKKLDAMLIKGFMGPFLVSFFIALFVLVMQTLWLYIDDIIGKGAGFFVIIEFLIYLSVSLIPMALPIGVLLAGVFLFGNLGENYELSSIKSAGISLFRVMIPVIALSAIVGITSWVFSDYIIPKSNLKFLSRLHDLKRQKPTLSFTEGAYNDDFYGYVIRIEKKSSDGMHIHGIQIHDHSNPNSQTRILAKDGIMYVTESGKYLIMQLENGEMLQLPDKRSINNSKYPFVKSKFDTLTKVFSLKEFDLERSDESLFKDNQRMKNSQQLRRDIDSLKIETSKLIRPVVRNAFPDVRNILANEHIEQNIQLKKINEYSKDSALREKDSLSVAEQLAIYISAGSPKSLEYRRNALGFLDRDINSNNNHTDSIRSIEVRRSKFTYELMIKYSFALICLIFIFVGAPLGAIVRKGGYGYPLLLCILVFVCYILLNTFFKRFSESLSIDTYLGILMPCIIISTLSIFLTWKALRDRNILDDIKLWFANFRQN